MSQVRIGIIIGSTRPGRVGDQVAKWVYRPGGAARRRRSSSSSTSPTSPCRTSTRPSPQPRGQYANDHTKAWADKIASFDGFVFVTPEYNHSTSGALKNAIDFIYAEWNNKAAGVVSYGVAMAAARGRAPPPRPGRAADRRRAPAGRRSRS